MNLICFPHYTCGGLLNDIFEQTFSTVGANGGINSFLHSVGKIGDSESIFDNYNPEDFLSKIAELKSVLNNTNWVGTHCWPGLIDTNLVDRMVVVTTTTYRSKLYRWTRAYHHYYSKSDPWLEVSGTARIDKERETAKNYLRSFLPVINKNVTNIEFSEIVETGPEFLKLTQGLEINKHMERWKSLNYFLYDNEIWNSTAFRRFYEAELETQLSKFYIYE
jgi:hypothetical protein